MNEKKITREEFEAAVASLNETAIYTEEECRKKVLALFEAAGITVEPAPVLPGVNGGDWKYEYDENRGGQIYCHREGKVPFCIASVRYNSEEPAVSANGQVMAGVKRLVEVVVADLRSMGKAYCSDGGTTQAVVDQLEKMGGVVDEFRK